MDDETLILADVARKTRGQVRDLVFELLTANGMPEDRGEKLAAMLSEGRWTHDFPITAEGAAEMGLPVSTDFPSPEVRDIMTLYPQARGRRPSVEYIPTPYGPQSERERRRFGRD